MSPLSYDIPRTILAGIGKGVPKGMEGRPIAPISASKREAVFGVLPAEDNQLLPEDEDPPNGKIAPIVITVSIILGGLIITALFQDELMALGTHFLGAYGQNWMDAILFLITAVSSTPLFLPIWGYALVGISMGYGVVHLAIVMAIGSSTGSLVTYFIGRYLGDTQRIRRRFPKIVKHPWTEGRPRRVTTLFLFLGTASPIPCDVLYAACGLKKYPWLLFWATLIPARFVRYTYLGLGFEFILA